MAAFRRDWLMEIETIHKEMDRLLDHYAGSKPPTVQFVKRVWEPAVDVYEADDNIVVIAELAGVDEQGLHIIVDRNSIAIKGERTSPGSANRRTYRQMEIDSGFFERIVNLPFAIDTQNTRAIYHNGMLEITATKSQRQTASRSFVRIFHSRESADGN